MRDISELLKINMRNAWNGVEESYKQIYVARKSVGQSKENLRLHRDSYSAGTITMTDLLQAQLLYQQSLDREVDSYVSYKLAVLEYRLSTGQ